MLGTVWPFDIYYESGRGKKSWVNGEFYDNFFFSFHLLFWKFWRLSHRPRLPHIIWGSAEAQTRGFHTVFIPPREQCAFSVVTTFWVPEGHVTGDSTSSLPKFRQNAAIQLQNSKLKSLNLFQLPNFFPLLHTSNNSLLFIYLLSLSKSPTLCL